MGVKSMANRVYSIIIVCLLILIALISWERGRSGRYQISSLEKVGLFLLDTKTGETYLWQMKHYYVLDREYMIIDEGIWTYVGKPKKTIDIEFDKGNQK